MGAQSHTGASITECGANVEVMDLQFSGGGALDGLLGLAAPLGKAFLPQIVCHAGAHLMPQINSKYDSIPN